MIIDGHAHAARDYATAESVIAMSKKYEVEGGAVYESQKRPGYESSTQCSVSQIARQHLSPQSNVEIGLQVS